MKNKCVSILGEDNFNEIYKYLSHHRMKGTEEKKVSAISLYFQIKISIF